MIRLDLPSKIFGVRLSVASAACALVLACACLNQPVLLAQDAPAAAQAAEPQAPAPDLFLSKSQLAGIAKNGKRNYEHCSEGKKLSPQDIARACVDFGHQYEQGGKDPDVPGLAFKRSCALGNAFGCGSLADIAEAAGDIPKARTLWSTGPCAADAGCQHKLFDTYADANPPDVASAVKIGLPLCDQGHDDNVCAKLKEINAPVDFTAIAENHRQQRILELIGKIGKNDLGVIALRAQVALCQVNVGMASGFAGLLAQGELKLAQKELSSAQNDGARMQAELDQLQGQGPVAQ